jgi:hypothetical protein
MVAVIVVENGKILIDDSLIVKITVAEVKFLRILFNDFTFKISTDLLTVGDLSLKPSPELFPLSLIVAHQSKKLRLLILPKLLDRRPSPFTLMKRFTQIRRSFIIFLVAVQSVVQCSLLVIKD